MKPASLPSLPNHLWRERAMTSRDIGLRVTTVREGRGLSTVSLARRVGVSQAQISRLENGKHGFRSSTLVKIAEALSVPPFSLFMKDDFGGLVKIKL